MEICSRNTKKLRMKIRSFRDTTKFIACKQTRLDEVRWKHDHECQPAGNIYWLRIEICSRRGDIVLIPTVIHAAIGNAADILVNIFLVIRNWHWVVTPSASGHWKNHRVLKPLPTRATGLIAEVSGSETVSIGFKNRNFGYSTWDADFVTLSNLAT